MKNIDTKKALLAVAIVAIVWWIVTSYGSSSSTTGSATSTTQIATSTTKVATTVVKKAAVPVANQPVSLSYQNALELYKGSLRIQLSGDAFCQANPNNLMFKNGTTIMVDNRSALARTIRLNSTSYSIAGYGFKIIKLSSATLPATLIMDCGTQQNIAKILLQK